MPNIKSSKKAVKVIAKKTEANHEFVAKAKNLIRKCDKAITAGEKDEAKKLLKETQKSIDKVVSKGLMKKNTANRQKRRLFGKAKEMK